MTSYTLNDRELSEWERRSDPKRDDGIGDPVWRLCNLYTIQEAGGRAVPFRPSPEQRVVIWCIVELGWQRIIIPKARQLGMSTVLLIIAMDRLAHEAGFTGALIDKKQDDASKKMREKVKFAWDQMHRNYHAALKVERQNDGELTLQRIALPGRQAAPPSTFQADVNFRGGTVSWLHISEWGAIQDDDRARSREIKAGALPAVERAQNGVCVIETTWKGGLDGELGPLVREALDTPEEAKGPKSWRILFFPWFSEPSYTQDHGVVDPESTMYFHELTKHGVTLTDGQKRWYAEKRRTASSAKAVKEEYPSLVHECWENLPQGSIYGRWLDQARVDGRMSLFLPPADYPVHSFWDLGMPMNTVCILAQVTPQQIRIIDVLMEVEMTLEERAAWLRMRGHNYGWHFLPHDANTDSASIGVKPIDQFRRVLGPNCRIVPRCHRVWDGISAMRTNFSRIVFACDSNAKDTLTPGGRVNQLVQFLARYRAERESPTGIAKDEPVHDRYSHSASALAQLGLALVGGLVEHANYVGDSRTTQQRRPLVTIHAGAGW